MYAQIFICDVNSAFARYQSQFPNSKRVDRRIVCLQCNTWDGIPSYKNRRTIEDLSPELLKVLHASFLQQGDTFVYSIDGRTYNVTANRGCWTFHQISGERSIIGAETFHVYVVAVDSPFVPLNDR